MIDPKARQKLKESIEGYLDEQITAFEFDEQLQEIETEDESVQEAISNLWLFYDDCKDHKIVARKEDWDFFQRLLLFLNSNLEIADLYENESRTKRNFTQLAAVIALLIQASMLLQGQHWLAITVLGALGKKMGQSHYSCCLYKAPWVRGLRLGEIAAPSIVNSQ